MDLKKYVFYEWIDDGWMNDLMNEGDILKKRNFLLYIKQRQSLTLQCFIC